MMLTESKAAAELAGASPEVDDAVRAQQLRAWLVRALTRAHTLWDEAHTAYAEAENVRAQLIVVQRRISGETVQ